MLKWATRIVTTGGVLVALAVATAAWTHRTQGREWEIATPQAYAYVNISPQRVWVGGYRRTEWDPHSPQLDGRTVGRYGAASIPFNNSIFSRSLKAWMADAGVGHEWHGFGIIRGARSFSMPSSTQLFCPTWAAIAVLLLPTALKAAINRHHRRHAAAGHCANCGYDLRATPEKCPGYPN